MRLFLAAVGLVLGLWLTSATDPGAQSLSQTWIQIEARPSLAQAEERARAWDERLDNVAGFRLGSGWYAIALGPFTAAEADARLVALRRDGVIPGDSFVSDGGQFGDQFFRGAGSTDMAILSAPDPGPVRPTDETPAEARAAERRLTGEERREIQSALAYEGFYRAAIDGAFGRGTRAAIEAWQGANRFQVTGFLTGAQRAELIGAYRDAVASLGLAPVRNDRAGIGIVLPLAALGPPVYDPPFVRYEATDGGRAMVLLISQPGDQRTLYGLYEVMQTLRIVPPDGARERRRNSFTLTGADGEITSHSFAVVADGAVKGFTLVWPADDPKRRDLVLSALERSFDPIPGVLTEAAAPAPQSLDLLSGLEIRRPEKTRSGFFVSETGAVLTTTEIADQCDRLTIADDIDMTLSEADTAAGLALLTPKSSLSPLSVARLSTVPGRINARVAVAGFPYEGVLGSPSLTFGTVADVRDLDGDPDRDRLALAARPGEAGGPVLDAGGSVVGMLLPRQDGESRRLPDDVNFSADAAAIAAFLAEAGLAPRAADPGAAIPPEYLTRLAADMTVTVHCWN